MKKDKKDKTEDRMKELENNWKRALADYKNLEKRVEEEKEVLIKFANSVLILRVLPVLDNLKMLMEQEKNDSVKMIVEEFERVLSDEGIEEIEASGREFDSEIMEAVEEVDGDESKVMEVTQRGYLIGSKVLRPARVKVGRGKEKTKDV